MAVDTRQKRFGLMNVSMPWRGTSHPLTSGIDADERAVMIFMYGGIMLAGGFAWTSIGRLFLFTAAIWSSGISLRLESTFRATSSEVRVRLYDETDATAVLSSVLTTSSTTLARSRTAELTLVDGNEYRVQVGVQSSAGAIVGASLVGLPP